MSLAPAKDTHAGLSDLLNYGRLVDDGVIQCKDGSFLAGWLVVGHDTSTWSASEKLSQSEQINSAYLRLGGGWAMWDDIVCVKASEYSNPDADDFQDVVTASIDDERREMFEGDGLVTLERKKVIVLQYTPSSRVTRKAATFLFDDGDEKDTRSNAAIAEDELRGFKAKLGEFETAMHGVARLVRFADYTDEDDGILCDDLVDYIDFRVTGLERQVGLTQEGCYLDGVFAYDYFDTAYPIKIGNKYILCLVIDGYPTGGRDGKDKPSTHPGILNGLAKIGCEYVWSTRFVFQDREAAIGEINLFEKSWHMQIHGIVKTALQQKGGKKNRDAEDMEEDTLDAEHRVSSEKVASGFYTSTLVFRGENLADLRKWVKEAQKILVKAKFHGRLEEWNAVEALFGTFSGDPVRNVRRPMLNTRNLADLTCWETAWRGHETHPNPLYPADSNPLMYALTDGNTPFRVNLFDGDLGNVLMFGPSGAGKTALLNLMAAQNIRYPGMRIWAWDFKYGMYSLAKECGWNYYDLGRGNELTLCPLGTIDEDDDAQAAKSWLADCYETQKRKPPSPKQSREIHRTVELMRGFPECRSLSDFCALVQDEDVRDAIGYYTIDGTAGLILDAERDTLTPDCNAVFECEEFVQSYASPIVSAVYSHLFRKFWRGLRSDRPSVMTLDEAHYGIRDKPFARLLDSSIRVIRSKNGSIIISTQSIQEAIENNIATLLRENTASKIFLPNSMANDEGSGKHLGPRDYYEMMGCTDVDREIIRTATKKKHYYIVSPSGKRLVDLALENTLLHEIISRPVIREKIRANA